MSKRMKYLWGLIGIWTLIVAVTVIFYFELWDAFYFFVGYWMIGCGLAGVVITALALMALFKERSKISPVMALILIMGLFFLVIKGPGSRWGTLTRFYLGKRSYETTVAKLFSARDEMERQKICAGKCEIELGAGGMASRVVFPLTRDDVLLGWTGIVYDPEGRVARAQKNESFFGCMFMGAERLNGDWYLCSFWHR